MPPARMDITDEHTGTDGNRKQIYRQPELNIIYIKEGEKPELPALAATIGFFDGVHRGHRFLIGRVVDEARQSGMASAVITFDRHPRQVLQADYQPELLTTLERKLQLLSETQVENTLVLHFDRSLAALPARRFMDEVLCRQLNVRKLLIGYDNRFGHDRAEDFDDYVRYGQALGIGVVRADAFLPGGEKVSSSVIRDRIRRGDIASANRLLGYAYTIESTIVRGYGNGHRLGFPTANLDMAACRQLIPAAGVYAVAVRQKDSSEWRRGMMNIGTRPTFNGKAMSMEVNIFHFDGDLYDKPLAVSFIAKIRDERRFGSLEALAHQLEQDREAINHLFDAGQIRQQQMEVRL